MIYAWSHVSYIIVAWHTEAEKNGSHFSGDIFKRIFFWKCADGYVQSDAISVTSNNGIL